MHKTMKTIKSLLAFCAFALIFSSCQKEEVNPASPVPAADATDLQPQTGTDESRDLGCMLLPAADYNKLPKMPDLPTVQTLPSSFTQICPPILSQGGEGSCVAWGVGYSARSIMKKYASGGSYSKSTNVYSPEYIYNQIKISSDCTGGSYVSTGLDLLVSQGVCTWSSMPYSSTNGCSLMPTLFQRVAAGSHKITSWNTVSRTVSNFKNLVYTKKPIIVAGPVDNTFYNLVGSATVNSYNSAALIGHHCYTVVGYDDSRQAFRIMNSWGTNWGDAGYAWVSYNMITTLFAEAYVMN
jgi:C1A family cysteine protease